LYKGQLIEFSGVVTTHAIHNFHQCPQTGISYLRDEKIITETLETSCT
jgi:hypothetical protein